MELKVFLLSLVALSNAQVHMHDEFYCYARDPIRSQLRMFGTLGQYESVRGNALETPLSNCQPSKLWLIARGGTRLPNTTQLIAITEFQNIIHERTISNIDGGRAQLCRPDADNILNWRFNQSITPDRTFELTNTGWNEMNNLAIRLQRAFPNALPNAYNQSLYRFRHTAIERTNENLNAFANGLFGHSNIVMDSVPTPDRLLRPIDSCRLYDQWAGNFNERNTFRTGPEFRQLTEQVNRKLGLVGPQQLSIDKLITLTYMCKYEQSWEPETPSAWCSAFSVANLHTYEYSIDLSTYYTSGYGGDERLFSNLNCHAMQDLLQFIQSDDPADQRARIHISHSNIFRLLLVSLGAYRDESHLHHQNFAEQNLRQWKTSQMTPHSGNIVFVKHDCAAEDNDIVILHNERPLNIPGCERPGVCKQETLLRLFSRFLNANCANLYCSRD